MDILGAFGVMHGVGTVSLRLACFVVPIFLTACANNSADSGMSAVPPGSLPPPQAPAALAIAPPAQQPPEAAVPTNVPAPHKQKLAEAAPRGSAPEAAPKPNPKADAAPPVQPDGMITGYVTSQVSLFDAQGKVTTRVNRESVPIPPAGLPFAKVADSQLVRVVVNGQPLLLDASEFDVRMAKRLVDENCDDLRARGVAPNRRSPASMGHGDC